jgi:hypothetical protein
MKTSNPILIILCALCFTIMIVSCGSNSVDSCTAFSQEFEDELERVNEAITAYSMDQSPSNCEEFKNSYLDYIDALRDYEDCANELGNYTEWEQSLQIAEDAINGLVC